MKLPPSFTVNDLADGAQRALEEFLLLSGDKRGLVEWLNGSYLAATSLGLPTTRTHRIDGFVNASAVARAQRTIVAMIESLRGGTVAAPLPEHVQIARVVDANGAVGWAPVDAIGLPLLERAMALVLSVFLTRPASFMTPPRPFPTYDELRSRPTVPAVPAARRNQGD